MPPSDLPFTHEFVDGPLSHEDAFLLYTALGRYLAQHIFDPEPEPIPQGTGHGGAEAARRRRLQRQLDPTTRRSESAKK